MVRTVRRQSIPTRQIDAELELGRHRYLFHVYLSGHKKDNTKCDHRESRGENLFTEDALALWLHQCEQRHNQPKRRS